MKIMVHCLICNKPFETYECWIKRGGGKYCGRKCKDIGQKFIMKGRIHLETTRRKQSSAHIGSKNPAWKGGLTELKAGIRNTKEYGDWRMKVFVRDKFACQLCGRELSEGITNFEMHHSKKSFSQLLSEFLEKYNQFSPLEDKETLIRLSFNYEPFWEVDNGITLCEDCHSRFDHKRERDSKGKFIKDCLKGQAIKVPEQAG